ncbi:retrovirus-related pol polyprotein from transposon TNT 1-94 [Tanacetum coccineum]
MRALLIQHGCEAALEVLPADMEAQTKAELNKKLTVLITQTLYGYLALWTGSFDLGGCDGHTKFKENQRKPSSSDSTYDDSEVMMMMSAEALLDWIIDSGCSYHMTPRLDIFFDFLECDEGSVLFADNKECKIRGFSKVRVQLRDGSSFVLNNVSEARLQVLEKHVLFGKKSLGKLDFYENYVLGKSHRVSFSVGRYTTQGVIDYVYLDLWGPSQVESLGGKRYFLSIIDDYSRRVWDYILRFKHEEFEQLCINSGIARHLIVARTPQQNGLAERMNRTLIDKLESRVVKCILLGYPESVKGYRLYRLDGKSPKIVTSRNVVFNESVMYKDTLKDSGAGDQETDQTPHLTNYQLIRDREPRTRMKPLRFQDMSNMASYVFAAEEEEDTHESLTYQEAVLCEDNSKWKDAMEEEMDSLRKNKKAYGLQMLEQLDVKTAFLHGNLEEVIYMRQQPGYEKGIRYADCFKAEIGSSLLKKKFDIKELGEVKKILGMEIIRDQGRKILRVSQSGYVSKILNNFRIDNEKSVQTLLGGHFKLSLKDCPVRDYDIERMSKVPYANAVGSLMYLMVYMSPDIAYAVNVVSRYLANPGKNHWEAVKWILKYLRGTANVGLVYGTARGNHVEVTGFVDLDYVKDPDKESEYMALTEAVKEAIWLRGLLEELGVKLNTVAVNCDKQGVLEAKTVEVLNLGTEHNAADALTKVVPGLKLQHCLELLSSIHNLLCYARAMIELHAEKNMKESMVIVVPNIEDDGDSIEHCPNVNKEFLKKNVDAPSDEFKEMRDDDEYDPYDDMYNTHGLSEEQEAFCDKMDMKFRCRRKYPRVGQALLQQLVRMDTGAEGTTKGGKQNRNKSKSWKIGEIKYRKNITCWNCIQKGYFQSLCSNLVASRGKEVNMAAGDFDDVVCCVENTVEDRIIDSGASFHATYYKEELERFKLHSGKIRLADDKTLDIAGVSDAVLKTSFGTSWTLKDVRYIPGLKRRQGNYRGWSKFIQKATALHLLHQSEDPATMILLSKITPGVANGIVMLKIVPETPLQFGVARRLSQTFKVESMGLRAETLKILRADSVFGYDSFVKVKDVCGEAMICTFIGSGSDEMRYNFQDTKSHQVIRSRDITFADSIYGAKSATDSSSLTNPIQKSQVVLVDIPENLTENDSIVAEHGLSSKITQSPGGSLDTSEGSRNSGSFEDSRRSYEEDSKDRAFYKDGGFETL